MLQQRRQQLVESEAVTALKRGVMEEREREGHARLRGKMEINGEMFQLLNSQVLFE